MKDSELDGLIGLGEYPDDRNQNYTVWFGETKGGFIYVCYSSIGKPLVLSTKRLSEVFRFSEASSLEDAFKRGLLLYKKSQIPDIIRDFLPREVLNISLDPGKKIYDIEGLKEKTISSF